jgi:amino acid transporter
VLALLLGGAFARLARDYPNLESPDDYVRPALGRDMGFLATALYWGASWIGNNAIAVAAFGYLVTLLPLAADSANVQMFGQLTLIWLMFFLNLLGPKQVARFQSLCVLLGLAPVAVVLLGGWSSFDAQLFAASWNTTGAEWNTAQSAPRTDMAVVFASLAPVFWAFVGLETGAMVARIVRDPDRNVPRATLAGIAVAGVVYIVSSVLVMGIVPAKELAASSAPFALVAGNIFGAWAMPIIALAAALKATGTLGGWMLVSGESGACAAKRGYLPRFFGAQLRNGAAHWGLVFITLGMTAITFITLAPTVAQQFGFIVNVVVLLIVLAYAAAGLSLMLGTPHRPPGVRERVLGAGALLACGLLFFSSSWDMIVGSLLATLLAWIAFRLTTRRRA